jgi:hypothetical protein
MFWNRKVFAEEISRWVPGNKDHSVEATDQLQVKASTTS